MTADQANHLGSFLGKVADRSARVGIIGLGYVGLPLAQNLTSRGFTVLGFDIDPVKVERLTQGQSYIGHIDDATVAAMLAAGFEATADFGRLHEPDAVLICVPTPLTGAREPDLRFVERSAEAIAASLRPGQLVVLESTTYPGTTRSVVGPILARRGLTCGVDYFLAFSPEREDPGNVRFTTSTIPKVVGGIDLPSRQAAEALYGAVVDRIVPVDSAEVAEACKILENTYRAVNIALVNELKVLFDRMGIDIWAVIAAAQTKPFGFQAFRPGPGLGGHCIPIDPFYLAWIARKHGMTTRFIELAGEINTAMPGYVVDRIADALNDRGRPVRGSKVLLLGMAYKPDVDDPRESPGFEIMERLLAKGALVSYSDPHIPHLPAMRRHPGLDFSSTALTPVTLATSDCVVVVTDHAAFDWSLVAAHARLVVDTRNALAGLTMASGTVVRA